MREHWPSGLHKPGGLPEYAQYADKAAVHVAAGKS
jgi:hypothetical protein